MKIEFKNVEKQLKKIKILENVNITMTDGRIYGLKGRNGSGKTVFLKMLSGFYEPTCGQIFFDKKEIHSIKECVPNMRALIEKPCFFPNLTGMENLQLLAKIQNKISDKEILESLEIVNLINEKDKKISQYSLGMKQKLGIAQVIMEKPHILVLDEPFNGIENISVGKIKDYLINEKKRGSIVIVSSNIENDFENFADVIFNFEDNRIES